MRNNNKYLIILIIALSTVILFYRLSDFMLFFGDQGWFYFSARDMVLTGQIPLVGIASSHPWLHQGAWWTYVLAVVLSIAHFNPLAPGYFSAGLGVITVGFVYFVARRLFSVTTGLIAAFLYATSPLIVINMRMPYHTVFIPFFVLLFLLALSGWIGGKNKYFPMLIFSVAMLYNFEIATTPFSFILILCLAYGLLKKKKFVAELANKKILALSFFAWFVPMSPMLLYDIHHGFPQTIKFVLWLGYRLLRVFGFPDIHGDTVFVPLAPFIPFTVTKLQDLLFLPQPIVAESLFIINLLTMTYLIYQKAKTKTLHSSLIALYLTLIVPFFSYLALQTSSEAYWPMLFPGIIIAFAYLVSQTVFLKRKIIFLSVVSLVLLVGLINAYSLLSQNYLMTPTLYGYPYAQRLVIAKQIVKKANGKKYTIIGKGTGSQFASFTMPYTYLTWWLGHAQSSGKVTRTFIIEERSDGIYLTQKK